MFNLINIFLLNLSLFTFYYLSICYKIWSIAYILFIDYFYLYSQCDAFEERETESDISVESDFELFTSSEESSDESSGDSDCSEVIPKKFVSKKKFIQPKKQKNIQYDEESSIEEHDISTFINKLEDPVNGKSL